MHSLNKTSKGNAAAITVWTIPWFVLNFLAFSGLSVWVAVRGLCQGISRRMRRK